MSTAIKKPKRFSDVQRKPVAKKEVDSTVEVRSDPRQIANMGEDAESARKFLEEKFADDLKRAGEFEGSMGLVSVDSLWVDGAYQRPERMAVSMKMAREWNWQLCGAIRIHERTDSRLFVYDGQHRAIAAWLAGIPELPAIVFRQDDPMTIQDEARVFVGQTQRRNISAFDKFRALLAAGDISAINIARDVEAMGYTIRNYNYGRSIRWVWQLLRAYKNRPIVARTALEVLSYLYDQYFEEQKTSGRAAVDIPPPNELIFGGLNAAELYLQDTYNESLQNNTNLRKLEAIGYGNIREFIVNATEFYGTTSQKAKAAGIINLLNKGRRSDNRYELPL